MHGGHGKAASRVSVLGVGAMGSVVAEVLMRGDRCVTVWNRSEAKTAPLLALGAEAAPSPQAALEASPVALLILLDAGVAIETLAPVASALAGITIINYSSGSIDQIEALRGLVEAAGGRFLQASILSYPRNIGNRDTYIVYSGDADAFARQSELLAALAGRSVILSTAHARALSAAFLVHAYTAIAGFYEAVALGVRLGLEPSWLVRRLTEGPCFFIRDTIEDGARRLERGDFTGDQATIDVHDVGFDKIAGLVQVGGASTPLFDEVRDLVKRASAAGSGGEDISALVKVLLRAEARAGAPEHPRQTRDAGWDGPSG